MIGWKHTSITQWAGYLRQSRGSPLTIGWGGAPIDQLGGAYARRVIAGAPIPLVIGWSGAPVAQWPARFRVTLDRARSSRC